MPKVHDIGKTRFIQILENYRVEWGWRFIVRGWTQEIEPPFRSAKPLIVRLPKDKALVYGRWVAQLTEEEALNQAIQGRVLSDEDFEEGWTPAPDEAAEEDFWHLHS
jgi:hypothetical protein